MCCAEVVAVKFFLIWTILFAEKDGRSNGADLMETIESSYNFC
ncbi:hypothetical protein MGWOODY_Hyp1160 [hydrothermal vent metagenome]|uniref:Uncharacterized protein n=1 Tax=hydrothermal vent metagenome TaxID=652676 RepID=A0A160U0V0_9ZZZZ